MYLQRWKTQVRKWLEEDLGHGDVTAALFTPDQIEKAWIRAKEDGVLAGLPFIKLVFNEQSDNVMVTERKKEGSRLQRGDIIAELEGPVAAILAGERLVLNLLQRLSGIASQTALYVQQVQDLPVDIVDTRKTTPGIRELEKYAVRKGGGKNHRFGLFDLAMLKDNHIKAAGGIEQAVNRLRPSLSHSTKIEVEVENLSQVEQALKANVDIIMLDNMSLEEMTAAVRLINGQAVVEASGGVTLSTVRSIAETGVDIISVGALTHSVNALDISLDMKEMKTIKKDEWIR